MLLLSFAAGVSRSRMRGCIADKRIRLVFVIPCVCVAQVVAKITQQLQLASALPDGVGVFDLFANAHAHADATVISNCTFKNNRARCAACSACVEFDMLPLSAHIAHALQRHPAQGAQHRG